MGYVVFENNIGIFITSLSCFLRGLLQVYLLFVATGHLGYPFKHGMDLKFIINGFFCLTSFYKLQDEKVFFHINCFREGDDYIAIEYNNRFAAYFTIEVYNFAYFLPFYHG